MFITTGSFDERKKMFVSNEIITKILCVCIEPRLDCKFNLTDLVVSEFQIFVSTLCNARKKVCQAILKT